jgi:hypothetical protein
MLADADENQLNPIVESLVTDARHRQLMRLAIHPSSAREGLGTAVFSVRAATASC